MKFVNGGILFQFIFNSCDSISAMCNAIKTLNSSGNMPQVPIDAQIRKEFPTFFEILLELDCNLAVVEVRLLDRSHLIISFRFVCWPL